MLTEFKWGYLKKGEEVQRLWNIQDVMCRRQAPA